MESPFETEKWINSDIDIYDKINSQYLLEAKNYLKNFRTTSLKPHDHEIIESALNKIEFSNFVRFLGTFIDIIMVLIKMI